MADTQKLPGRLAKMSGGTVNQNTGLITVTLTDEHGASFEVEADADTIGEVAKRLLQLVSKAHQIQKKDHHVSDYEPGDEVTMHPLKLKKWHLINTDQEDARVLRLTSREDVPTDFLLDLRKMETLSAGLKQSLDDALEKIRTRAH